MQANLGAKSNDSASSLLDVRLVRSLSCTERAAVLATSPQTMPRAEADEVAELKKMFNRRPAWDSTPLRARPAALKGLQPITRE